MILKKRIKEKGFTHEQVANALGVSRSTFQQKLAYDSMTTTSLRRIAEVIGCKIGDFFTDEMSDDLPENDKEYYYVVVKTPKGMHTIAFEGKFSIVLIRKEISEATGCLPVEVILLNQYKVTKREYNKLCEQNRIGSHT